MASKHLCFSKFQIIRIKEHTFSVTQTGNVFLLDFNGNIYHQEFLYEKNELIGIRTFLYPFKWALINFENFLLKLIIKSEDEDFWETEDLYEFLTKLEEIEFEKLKPLKTWLRGTFSSFPILRRLKYEETKTD